MKKGIKITREDANKIIIEWNNSGKPHRDVVISGPMGWFDIRHLNIEELQAFKAELVEKLTGKKWNGKEATIDINL